MSAPASTATKTAKAAKTPRPKVTVLHVAVADVPKPKGSDLDHTAVVAWLRISYRGKTETVVVIHVSGKFDAPAADVAKYHHELVAKYRADLLTTTESEEPQIAREVRKELGSTWMVRKCGEYIVATRRAVLVHDTTVKPRLKRLTKVAGEPDWRNLFIGIFRLRLVALDLVITQTVGHTPAGVEMGSGWRKTHPVFVKTWQEGMAAWSDFLQTLPEGTLALANMDANINQHLKVWRDRLAKALVATSVYAHVQPAQGSHGGRLIDVISFYVATHPAHLPAKQVRARLVLAA